MSLLKPSSIFNCFFHFVVHCEKKNHEIGKLLKFFLRFIFFKMSSLPYIHFLSLFPPRIEKGTFLGVQTPQDGFKLCEGTSPDP